MADYTDTRGFRMDLAEFMRTMNRIAEALEAIARELGKENQ